MYSVTVRDHILIAHSLPNPEFGPAQGMHGATYVIDAEFRAEELTSENIVIDIGFAHEVLKNALAPLNYQNLDALDALAGKLTTTEFLASHIHAAICESLAGRFEGALRITLHESHVASASYEAPVH